MKGFNSITSALTGTALLASSALAQLDPIVIKVCLVLHLARKHARAEPDLVLGIQILLRNKWHSIVSISRESSAVFELTIWQFHERDSLSTYVLTIFSNAEMRARF